MELFFPKKNWNYFNFFYISKYFIRVDTSGARNPLQNIKD